MKQVLPLLSTLLASFLAGVFLASFVISGYAIAGLFVLVGTSGLFLAPKSKFVAHTCFAIAVGVALGIARFTYWDSVLPDSMLMNAVGSKVELSGAVLDEPDIRENGVRLTVTIATLQSAGAASKVSGKVQVFTERYPLYQYGDAVNLSGTLELPQKFTEENGKLFDYPAYLRAKGVSYQMFRPRIDRTASEQGNIIIAKLLMLKHAFLENLADAVPEPESALGGGLLLGGKQTLGAALVEKFRIVGLVHIIVLSGYNMTIVAEWLGSIFRFLRFGFSASIGAAATGILFFALMAGAGATVVRASLMALLVLLARATGRTYDFGRALLIAGAVMVAHDPAILAFDPSFQLSFLASLGLIYISPLLEQKTQFLKKHKHIRDAVVATLSTQLFVLPLLLYQTGMFSVVGTFANILVLPIVPFAMLFVFLTGITGFFGGVLTFVPALIAYLALHWMVLVSEWGSFLPFSALTFPPISGFTVVTLYFLLAAALYVNKK